MTEHSAELLPILPLDEVVVLPHMTVTIAVQGEPQRAAIEAANQGNRLVLLVPRIEGKFGSIGTVARVQESGKLPTGAEVSILTGQYRARLGAGQADVGGALWVQVDPAPDDENPSEAVIELAREYRALVENLLEIRGASGAIQFLREARAPGHLADLSGYSPDFTLAQKLEILEALDVEKRLTLVIAWTKEALGEADLKDRIRTEVAEGMQKNQREFILRQQLEAIKKELGEGGDDVVSTYRKRLADAGMPEKVAAEVEREIDRLERTSAQSPEHGWIRTYLDWMLDLPWNVRSDDNFDLGEARKVLDADHTGLEDVKDRIIEFLAVRKLRKERGLEVIGGRGSGAIITLVGPPGVGKTSLGESVARALGRKFARVSLGGIRDEADVRGFRRTYVGAQPGRIVRALKEAGTKNPVIMLDEIDKVGADWRGDPSAALLEVLDPAQNNTFRDHYLEVDLDLSEVLFIPTGNVSETIPPPLLDRMELIRLDGYTEQEKLAIARDHLLPRQVAQAGLRSEEIEVGDDAILKVVTDHTREAGVRNLERELGRITRKLATRIATGAVETPVKVGSDQIRDYLGKPKFDNEVEERTAVPGVATGLAVTGAGGDVLFVEVATSGSDGNLTLTGQLGDVMKESAQIALSYVRSHAERLGISAEAAAKGFHIHVPEGAVPKDGPSAGVTMTTAMVSLLTGRPVRSTVGMTGEVTLQGLVLPIGGVKQKVLAAHRMGLTEVILPRRNEKDLDDVPESVRTAMKFHLASRVDDVLSIALEPPRAETGAAA
ncbi:MAG: endopeptidase La [Candidatus Dormibacteria bacterium]|jgi:ATP-dependent Lon protease